MFRIIPQADPRRGCIPACARSVLAHVGARAPSEEALVEAMYPSGFTLLARAFEALGLGHRVERERPATPAEMVQRVLALNARGRPVLLPIRTARGVHCVVAEGCSPAEAVLHDPADGSVRRVPWAEVSGAWTGDLACVVPGTPFTSTR
jgi:hypothetical protein